MMDFDAMTQKIERVLDSWERVKASRGLESLIEWGNEILAEEKEKNAEHRKSQTG